MARKKSVEAADVRLEMILLDDLEDFQGGLKEMTDEDEQRLQTAILKHGFVYPAAVWEKPSGGYPLLDGHQRVKVLRKLRDEGYSVPEKIPVILIPAKNKKDAKEKLLLAVSQYGQIVLSGLEEYLTDSHVNFDEMTKTISLPKIDLSFLDFVDRQLVPDFSRVGIDEQGRLDEKKKIRCPKCGHAFTL